jgi:hypothetical protein
VVHTVPCDHHEVHIIVMLCVSHMPYSIDISGLCWKSTITVGKVVQYASHQKNLSHYDLPKTLEIFSCIFEFIKVRSPVIVGLTSTDFISSLLLFSSSYSRVVNYGYHNNPNYNVVICWRTKHLSN